MKKWFPNHAEAQRMINYLYTNYPKGFYVNAEKKMKDAKGAAKYIGRYLARPAIADYGFLYRYMEDMEIIKDWRRYHYDQKGKTG